MFVGGTIVSTLLKNRSEHAKTGTASRTHTFGLCPTELGVAGHGGGIRYIRGKLSKMNFIKNNLIRMIQHIKAREKRKGRDNRKSNSPRPTLRIGHSRSRRSILAQHQQLEHRKNTIAQ